MQGNRRIKVGYTRRYGKVSMQVWNAQGDVMAEKVKAVFWTCPNLRLCGGWLAQAGFQSGEYVNVQVSDGRLLITQDGGR
jgi:hypothetical protein